MATVNMHEAKTNLSKLVQALVSGAEQEIVISRNGDPAVRMTAIGTQAKPRPFGHAREKIAIAEDFDRDDVESAELFEGREHP